MNMNKTSGRSNSSELVRAAEKVALVVFVAVLVSTHTQGAEVFKADNTDNLDLGSSWVGGVPPGPEDVAVWNNTVTTANSVLLGADLSWGGIRILDPGGAVQISGGNVLGLGAAGLDTRQGTQPLTLACPVLITAPQEWNLGSAVTVSGVISGAAGNGITITGTGQLNISGANNNFIEGITINSGVLNLSASSSMPVKLGGGQLTVSAALGNPIEVLSSGTIRCTANRTLSGPVTGEGTIVVYVTGSGTYLTLNGSLVGFRGTIVHHASSTGSLRANSSGFIGCSNAVWDLGPQGGFSRANSAPVVYFGALAGGQYARFWGGTVTYEIGHLNVDAIYSGSLNQAGLIVKVGTGTWILDGNNSHSATLISNGVLQVGSGGSTGTLGAGPVTNLAALVFNRGDTWVCPNAISGSGTVTNLGFGLVILTGTNTWSGPTYVACGELAFGSDSALTGTCEVAGGAALGVVITRNNDGVALGNISFGPGALLNVDLGEFGNPTVPVLSVAGQLELAGDVTVNIAGTNLAVGTITLLEYASRSGTGAFVLGSLPVNVNATLTDDAANRCLLLVISDVGPVLDPTLVWVGDEWGVWDVDNPANPVWRALMSGQLTNYTDGVPVLFDDSATGSTVISLNAFVNPGTVTVSNATKEYVFTGSGAISGTAQLIKRGPGIITISNQNYYTGLTRIEQGVFRLAGDYGNTGGGDVTNNSVLVIDKTGVSTLPHTCQFFGQVTGTGSVLFLGVDQTNSVLEMQIASGAGNPFTGGAVISNGCVRLVPNPRTDATRAAGKSTGFGIGQVTFLGESTLELADYGLANESAQWGDFACPIHIPAGCTGTLLTAGRMRVSGPVTGAGTLNLTVVYVRDDIASDFSAFTGRINIRSYDGNDDFRVANPAGCPQATLHLGPGVYMYSIAAAGSVIPIGALSADEGSTLSAGNSVTWLVGGLGSDNVFAGNLAGAPTIVKTGTGTWQLAGTNNAGFTGTLIVSNGVVALGANSLGDTDLPSAARISVAAEGTLDVSARADATLNVGTGEAAQTITGAGTLRGNLLIGPSGTLEPGFGLGTLTVTGQVSLAGTAVFELNRTENPNSDRVQAAAVSAGGRLVVTNVGPPLQAGDAFQLFNTPVSGQFVELELPWADPSTGATYTWENRLAIDGTIRVVQVQLPVNPMPTNMLFSVAGDQLTLQWPEDRIGWTLQTNSIGLTAPNAWFEFPPGTGSRNTNRVVITIDPTKSNVFFRLVYP